MLHTFLSAVTLPFIGHVNLSGPLLLVFIICLLAVVGFEFVNGFHDTANAVATVIYTKALRPIVAIPWSGCWNFLGVFIGGVTVAMGLLKLVPLNELMALPVAVGACLVLSILSASILWNLGTWYLGIPCSSSHTLIGAMIGGSLAFTWYYGGSGVNWSQVKEIGLSLVLSPVIGFGLAALLMLFLKHVLRSEALFHIPQGENDRPPLLIRLLLITTCTLVSFFHGSNDGQKGVGLLMLILIAFLPAKYAVNHHVPDQKIITSLHQTEPLLKHLTSASHKQGASPDKLQSLLQQTISELSKHQVKTNTQAFKFRQQLETIVDSLRNIKMNKKDQLTKTDKSSLESALKVLEHETDFAPVWVIATISISLGLGTMIGWKRIVVTIGEKIGNQHLNYAQGASSEIVAASTIGLSTGFGLPVSTTHVLSSGIAGAMVASGGSKNLNTNTLKNIALAWVLTLPVAIILAIVLFSVFHLLI